MNLTDKTFIVTGASSGIGAAAALLLASKGASVVLGARRQAELDQLVGQIKEGGGNAVCLSGDVSDEAYSKSLVSCAKDAFGRLDGAFNNAGITGHLGPLPDMQSSNWQKVTVRGNLLDWGRGMRRVAVCPKLTLFDTSKPVLRSSALR